MRAAAYLSSLLFVTFIVPTRAGEFIQAQKLPFSASASCEEVLDRNHETDYGFVSRRWRETGGRLDSPALDVVAQMVMAQYKVIEIDEGSTMLQMQSAVAMASDEDHDEQNQVGDIFRHAQHELQENGFVLSNHRSGIEDDFTNPFAIGNAVDSVLKTKRNLRNGAASSNANKDGTIDFYIDKRHLKELLEHKRKWEQTPIFAVVNCNVDEAVHGYRHNQKQETPLEAYYAFYTVTAILVAFLVSRLKLKINFQLDFGEDPDQKRGKADDPVPEPTVTVDAVVINDEEPVATTVY